MNMSGCFKASLMRLHAMSNHFCSRSQPTNRLRNFAAAAPLVPDPIYGSRTMSQTCVVAAMHRCGISSGNATGCSLFCSRAIRHTVPRPTLA